jgi:urea transport system permease protein
LLWGYMGILSLGQALFFALGGYAFGMHLILLGANGGLPNFMVFQGYAEIPAHWKPFYSFPFALLSALLVPGVVAGLFGWLAFRSRVRGVYFAILSQALTYAAALLFFRNDFGFGGNNGLTDFKSILGFDIASASTRRALYIVSILSLAGIFLFFRWIGKTKFGKVMEAIRDGENRVLFSGYATVHFKLFIFTLAAVTTGLGGALYVSQVGIINPSEMTPDKSLEGVIWVAVGGRGTLVGPIIGAVSVNALKSWATRATPESWLFIMGGMFIFVVLFLPGGIASIPGKVRKLQERWPKLRLRRSHATATVMPSEDAPANERSQSK